MPGYNIEGKKIVISDDRYKEKYWPILSKRIKKEFLKDSLEIDDPEVVQKILKNSFNFFCEKLENLIQHEKRFSFYLFCHNLHEDSIEIFLKQSQGYSLDINEEKFAGARRILKIVLEQSTKYKLKGSPNFFYEMQGNLGKYITYLEEIIYVGEWALISSEFLARSQLFPKSIGIGCNEEKEEISFLIYQPYPIFFSYIFKDLPNHDSEVALTDCIDDFKELIKESYSIEYDDLCYFIAELLQMPSNRLGVTIFPEIIKNIKEHTSVDNEFLNSFYAGLQVSKDNALSIQQSFYKNQDQNRYIFRPILEYIIDDKVYHLVGSKKWPESLSLLTTNCFPFGLFPEEWKINKALKKFIEEVDNSHDKVLQNPIIEKLKSKGYPFEVDIEKFRTFKKQFINIGSSVGDIDILFLDIENSKIYICECKHNRSRFDYNNWKRDYKNFSDKYEKQLKRKIEWAEKSKKVIQNHFKLREENPIILDLSKYDIEGIFIINAPTIYMYNSKYKCYTIHDFGLLLKNEPVYEDFTIYAKDRDKTYLIEHPYFDSISRQI